ncbi:gliding motility-associated C-terminal domain-containing protein [Chitinophagaceae bacterium MMS25-I14]
MPGKTAIRPGSVAEANFTGFPERARVPEDVWNRINPGQPNDPDAYYETLAGGKKYVEVASKRTVTDKYYIDPEHPAQFMQEKGYNALNYQKNGKWYTVDAKLKPQGNNIYEAPAQWEPVGIDINSRNTYIHTASGNFTFNQWSLYGSNSGGEQMIAKADWSHYTIGENGLRVTSIFPGIDAEMRVARGTVKTNFIIHDHQYSQYKELYFRDNMEGMAAGGLHFEAGMPVSPNTPVYAAVGNNKSAIRISPALVYEKNNPGGATTMPYRLDGNTLNVVVPGSYLKEHKGDIVIDPQVTSTNSIAQALVGTPYNASCTWTTSCDYTINVVPPAEAVITDVQSQVEVIATAPCGRENFGYQVVSGTCISPGAGSVWISGGITGPGTMWAGFYSEPNLVACMPAAACSPAGVDFTFHLYRTCVGPTTPACDNTCLGLNNPLAIKIVGYTAQYASITAYPADTTCYGNTLGIKAVPQYGVTPYATTNWSFSSTGTPSIGTGDSISLGVLSPGTYTVYANSTDACGTVLQTSKVVKVYAIPAVSVFSKTNPSICGVSNGTITLSGLTASTTYSVSYTNNGTPVSTTITSDASGAVGISGLSAGTYTSFQLSAHGCTSTIYSNTVTLSNPSAPLVTVTGNPCNANMIVMTASPSWEINAWQYNSGALATDTIKYWNSTGTVAAGTTGSTGSGNTQFNTGPLGVSTDIYGNVYVADNNNHRIMKWQPGASTGILVAGGNGAGSGLNQFNAPYDVFADADSNVYVADRNNSRIIKWAPGASSGVVVAGGNGAGSALNQINNPRGVFVDAAKNVYVADLPNNRIMKWTPGATAGTVAAGGNGAGSAANQISSPTNVYVDASGTMYIADFGNNRIVKWLAGATSGTVVAGGNGAGSAANQFNGPRGVRLDGNGFLYIADQNNNRIQRWAQGAASGITVAGGNGAGTALNQVNNPVALDLGTDGSVYALEQNNVRVTKFTPKTTDTIIPGASGTYAATVTSSNGCTASPVNFTWTQKDTITISANTGSTICSGTSVTFSATVLHGGTSPVYTWKRNGTVVGGNSPTYTTTALTNRDVISCTFSSSNPCTVTDSTIMTVNPLPAVTLTGNPCTANMITMTSSPVWSLNTWKNNGTAIVTDTNKWNQFATLAAGTTGSAGAALTQLNLPLGVFADAAGNVYVADRGNNRVVKWAPGASAGVVVAGGNGAGSAANQLSGAFAVSVDADTNVYVMDWGNARVQKWLYGATSGTTVAGGNGGGSALNQLNASQGLFVDVNKNVYVSDNSNARVVKWAPGATSGVLVAGGNGSGSGLNQFNNPVSVYVDGLGNMYVSDYNNARVVKWTPGATTGIVVAGGNGAGNAANQLNGPRCSWLDGSGNIYICDQNNSRIQRWAPGATSGTTVVGGTSGNGLNQLNSPTGIYVSSNGDIYTVEQGSSRALKFSPKQADTLIPTTTATYTATVTDFNGCVNTASINWIQADTLTLSANPGYQVCAGTSVTFTATVLHPGTSPVYTWKKNGSTVGGNSATYTATGLANNDRISCTFTSSSCTVSDSVVMTVNPMPNATISGTPCTGKTLTLNPGVTSLKTQWSYNGSAFQTYDAAWQPNGTVVAGGNGAGNAANQLNNPCTVFVDAAGNIIIADNSNQRIMKWAPGATSGTVVAGGNGSGSALNQFVWGNGVIPGYNSLDMYVSDANNNRVAQWIQGAATGTLAAGGNGNGAAANQVRPFNAALDGYGNLFLPDANGTNPRVQKWKLGYASGTTVAGGNGVGSAANQLNNPYAIYIDNNATDLYITDYVANRVQKWTAGGSTGTTVAGGNGAGAAANQLNSPYGILVDGLKNVYISDGGNNRIQRWAPGATSGITIIGGNGAGTALNQLNSPDGIFMDGNGNIYIPENSNQRVTEFQAYNTDSLVPPNAGTYKVIVTTFKGCSDSSTYVVNQTPTITSKTSSSPTTCTGTNGSIALNGLTGSTTFSVTYKKNGTTVGPVNLTSNASGVVTIGGLGSGTYTNISLTATSGCVSLPDTSTIILSDPTPPATPSASSNTPVCAGQTLNLSTPAVSGVTYSWTGPNTFSSTSQTPSVTSVTAAATGTYSVTITNTATGCTSAAGTTAVVINPLPAVPTVGSNSPICTGQTINLTSSTTTSGATYSWTGPNSFSTTTQNPSITGATTAAAGTYSVVSVLNGCQSAPATVNVAVNVTPVVSSSSSINPSTCSGTNGSITLNGMAASTTYTINYSKNGTPITPVNLSSTSGGVITIPNLGAGTYTNITVGSGAGCTSAPVASVTLTDPSLPAAPTPGSNTPVCAGQPLNLTASAATGVTYSWTGPNSFTSSAQNPTIAAVTAAAAGTYSVTVTNTTTLCTSAAATTTVVVKPLPIDPIAGSNSPVCTGQTLNLTASATTGGATYSWTGPNSFSTATQNPSITGVTTAAAGTYSVVTLLNGCQSAITGSVTVTVNVTPVISSSSFINPSTCSGTNGSITMNGMAASTPYTINYSKNGTPATPVNISSSLSGAVTIPNLGAGTYTNITVGSGAGCTSAPLASVTLTDPALPATPVAGSNSPVCAGQPLNLTSSTATSGVTYSWTGPNSFTSAAQNPTIAAVTAAAAGTYTVTVTSTSTLCTSAPNTTTVTVKPLPIDPTAGSNSPVCQGQTLNLTATATTSGATYSWSGPNSFTSTTQNPSVSPVTLAANGAYTVYTLLNGCQSANSSTVNVTIKPLPAIPTVSSNSPVCSGTGNTLQLNAASTTTGVTYSWAGPNSFTSAAQNPSVAAPTTAATGTYTVTVALAGCTVTGTTNVIVNQTPGAPGVTNISYCQYEPSVALVATGTNLKWYTAATGGSPLSAAPIPSTQTPGSYTWYVTQTDGVNGCESQRSAIVVTVKAKPLAPTGTNAYTFCQFESTQPLTVTGQNLLWYLVASGGTGSSIAPAPNTAVAGTYSIWVSQTVNGCESDRFKIDITVKAKPAPPVVTTPIYYCQYSASSPLTAIGQGLKWYNVSVGGNGSSTAPTPSTGYQDTITYYVSQTVNGCESDRSRIDVIVHYLPNGVIIASKSQVCQYDTASFTYFGNALPGAQYDWKTPIGVTTIVSGNASGPGPIAIRFDSSGKYEVRMQVNDHGCVSNATFYDITVKPAPYIRSVVPANACVDETVQIALNYATAGIDNYTWNFDGGNIMYGSEGGPYGITWHMPGEYHVSVIANANGCPSLKQTDTITVHTLPDVKINNVSANDICSADMVTFSANDADSGSVYTWSPAVYFGGFANAGPVASAQVVFPGYIVLHVTSFWGCSGSDSVFVNTHPCCDVALPDAFTPNGDGRNDIFRIITKGNHKISTFRVVNRWGQVVFETADEKTGWDGSFNGVQQDIGIYYYYLKYKCTDGEYIEKRGEVTLIR